MTTETKPPVAKAVTGVDEIKGALVKMEPQFRMALPPQISPEKFIRVAQTAIQTNPLLQQANRQSLFAACMKAAQDGLIPDGREAALVTFKTQGGLMAQYMPMIGGILKKVRNSGELSSINAQVVYAEDEFDYWLDEDGEHLKHKPNLGPDRGDRRLVYALARTKDGAVYVEVMTAEQVMAVKGVSRAKDSGPWAGPFEDEMWRKTAIRRLSKRLPMSTDLEQVIQRDDEMYDLKGEDPKPPVEPSTRPRRLATIIEAKAQGEPLPAEAESPQDAAPASEEVPI